MKIPAFIIAFATSLFILSSCGGGGDDKDSKIKKLEELRAKKAEIETEIALLEKETGSDTGKTEKTVGVSVISPKKGAFERFAEFQGNVVSEENVNLGSEVGGRIIKILVKEGQSVSKGQTLATFDSEVIQKNLEEVENALDLATATYNRQKNLWDQQIGSEMQYLQAKNQKENLEKRMESIRTQMNKASLKSPINGSVDKIFLNAGDMAAAGAPVVRVVNNDQIKISAEIPERFVGKLKAGDSVGITLSAIDKDIAGKVRSVGQVIDVANRTFGLVVDPVGKQNKEFLKPNMLAIIKAAVYRKKDALSVPTDIIRFEGAEKFVYTVTDNMVAKVPVETGETSDGFTEILSGLTGSEQVVSEGLKSITNGTVVKIVNKP